MQLQRTGDLPVNFNPVTPAIVNEVRDIVGGPSYVLYGDPERMADYSHDETVGISRRVSLPEMVVKPGSAAEISAIMRLANRERIPVTPRGAGSGLSGGAVPVYGGILLSSERMNRILDIDCANLVIVVEPGVVTNEINQAVRECGLFYAGYPMSLESCYIGGNVAENAGGGRAIKYGVTGRYVLGLEVVLPTGEIVQMGGKRVKDVTGYDLVHLMVGSEGTLGIFTRIILRLQPLPAARVALLVPFADVRTAIAAVPEVITRGHILPASIEFMDGQAVRHAYDYVGERPPHHDIEAMLLFEMDGADPDQMEAEYAKLIDLCLEVGALDVYLSDTPGKIKQMWLPRQKLAEGLNLTYPVQSAEDIVVPPARIPDLLAEMPDFRARHGVEVISFGHAGDGNLHLRILRGANLSEEAWAAGAQARSVDLYEHVTRLGGTISAEHGIGYKLAKYLPLALDPAVIALQRRIKAAFDPLDILNPGKIFP
jgi:glycolate oxidase